MKVLLEAGADHSAKNIDGFTSLIWAAREGNKYVVKVLLEKGADHSIKDNCGGTALIWAARS